MAWTNWGFDGTINEAQWSQMAGLLGNGYVAADSTSCVVTAVPGARSVSVAEGTLYGDGIVSVNVGADTVAMTTPVNGQWFVIALRRTWATNTAATVAIAGATTSTTTPTAPPSTLPTLNASPGVLTDQPIAWAWCNSANTTVVVFDMRQFPVRRMPLTVANNVVRDGIFQTPTQGQQVWRNDLGAVETYYGAYNAISNPGGRDSAGWYVEDRAGGLIPVRATTVTVGSGSATVNDLGVVSFTSATSVQLSGVFTSRFKNYKLIAQTSNTSDNSNNNLRMVTGSTIESSANYRIGGRYIDIGAGSVLTFNSSTYTFLVTSIGNGGGPAPQNNTSIDILLPQQLAKTAFDFSGSGTFSASFWYVGGGNLNTTTSYDGFIFYPSGGNFTGTIQVFGYND